VDNNKESCHWLPFQVDTQKRKHIQSRHAFIYEFIICILVVLFFIFKPTKERKKGEKKKRVWEKGGERCD
jgi:hypothetical protein